MLKLVLAAAAAASPQLAAPAQYVRADLITSTTEPRPGSTIFFGIRMTPEPGWHGYWSNPGESGLAPKVRWTAPAGVRFGPLLHPAPTLLQSMGLVSYVHAGPHVLLSRVSIGRSIAAGTNIPVTADVSWAACSKNQCVPQHALMSLEMVAGDGAASPDSGAVEHALAALPSPAPPGSFSATAGKLILELPRSLRLNPRTVRFYPDENGHFDAIQARATDSTPIRIESPLMAAPPDQISGVVTDGLAAYRLEFARRSAPAATSPVGAAPQRPTATAAAVNPSNLPSQSVSSEANDAGETSPSHVPLKALALLGIGGLGLLAFSIARRRRR